jgi:uncharacterized protein YndB with AHSA1/START domain
MKTALKVLLGLAGLAAVLAAVGLMLPGHYRVERTAVIAAKPAAVFPLIADLRASRQWGVWFRRDPAMRIAYSPVTTGVGAWSQWASKSQGSGKMTISSVRPPSDFEYRMEFADMGIVSTGAMALAPNDGGSTRVTMSNEGDLGHNPAFRWFGLFMDRMVGPDFEEGLANLKKISEAPAR